MGTLHGKEFARGFDPRGIVCLLPRGASTRLDGKCEPPRVLNSRIVEPPRDPNFVIPAPV
jgi:hypothetical protein